MDFFSEMFSELTTPESLSVLLWLFLAGLIGFLTAYFYWKGQQSELQKQVVIAERDASELRIRNTELLMTQEEVRKEISDVKSAMANVESSNKLLKAEKGQLYADMVMAKKEAESLRKGGSKVDINPQEEKSVTDTPEISLENVMKASATLSGTTGPAIEDAQSALNKKKSSGDNQKDAADFIKNALGGRIKTSSSGQKDNLQMIKGVGPFIEGKLNRLGIYTFEQISQLDEELIEKLTDAIQFFPGRILRDDWVGQAKGLMK